MVRLLLPLLLLVVGLALAVLLGCSGGDDDWDEAPDAGTDVDADSDVDIEYPEHTNPNLDFRGLMTGPISPPPENVHPFEHEEPAPEDGDYDEDDADEPSDD